MDTNPRGEMLYTGFDFYNCDMHFSDKQKALRQEVREFVDIEVLPQDQSLLGKGGVPLGDRPQHGRPAHHRWRAA